MDNVVNRWVGYISISIVMVFGILFLTGLVGHFDFSTRLMVAGVIFIYILLRIFFIWRGRQIRPDSSIKSVRNDYEEVEIRDPNNT